MPRQGIRLLLVLTALLALVAIPSAADAKKKKKKKTPPVVVATATQSTSADGQLVTTTANCPSGLLALGGGFSSEIVAPGGVITDLNVIYESRRTAGGNGWTISGAREDAGGPGPAVGLTASVYCRTPKVTPAKKATAAKKKKKKINVSEVSAIGPSASNLAVSTATATCPGNRKVVSGGFSATPPPVFSGSPSFPIVFADLPAGNGRTASLVQAGAGSRTVTTFAYCATRLSPVVTSGSASLAGTTATTAFATAFSSVCPAGRRLAGGGFQDTQPASPGSVPLATDSVAAGAQWKHAALNISPVAGSISSYGSCI